MAIRNVQPQLKGSVAAGGVGPFIESTFVERQLVERYMVERQMVEKHFGRQGLLVENFFIANLFGKE